MTQVEIDIWRMDSSGKEPFKKISMDPAPVSLDDATRWLPGGGYTTFRTYGRFRVLRLADHFHRLEETARLAGTPVRLNRDLIVKDLHQALAFFPEENARVRIILDLEDPEAMFVLVERLVTPDERDYRQGVKVVTRHFQRENPKAKLTNFIETAAAIRQDLPAGVNEAVMVDMEDRLLEGLSSNFFAVKDGLIWTAEQGVLSGITRGLVLDVIREMGIPLRLEGIPFKDLPGVEEAFITSASRAVLPVTDINGADIGSGTPGEMTRILMQGYQDRLAKELDTV